MNIHKSIVVLLLTIFWSAISYGQDCASFVGPVVLDDQIDTVIVFPIYNLDSADLSSPNQGVCKVNIHFESEYPRDLQVILVSPAGEEITLIGPIIQNSIDVLPGTSWDISFIPLDSTAMPDPGYQNQWSNDQGWLSNLFFPTVYTGSYYPFVGDIGTFREGFAYGEWKLKYQDGLALHNSTLHSFSIEFCNPSGIDCEECVAEADTLMSATIRFCENDPIKTFEFSDYLKDTMHLDNLDSGFTYNAVVVLNDTVIDYRIASPLLDMGNLPVGAYQVYGMSYDTLYKMDVPKADSTFTIDSLRIMMDSLPRIFCGDLTQEALIIDIEPIDTTYITQTICSGDSLIVGDSIFKSTIITQVGLTNQYNCDSIIVIDLEVISIPLTVIDTILCHGDSLEFNSTWYTDPTNEPFRLTSTSTGCDSTVLLDLRFHPYNFTQINKEICSGDVFPFFGVDRNVTGVYRGSLMDQNGCDSVVQLNLNVVTEFIVDTTTTLCIGDTFLINTEKFFTTGMYNRTFPSTLGCDSTVNLDLTIVQPIRNDVSETICFGDSLQLGDQYFNETGEFIDTLESSIGCDSIVTLELIVRPQNGSNAMEMICFGDSVQSAGNYYKASGVYRDTLVDRFMCDSIVVLDLTIRPENRVDVNDMICFGDSLMVGDSTYTRTGVFETTLLDANSCDSIVVMDLVVMDQISSTLDSTICSGDSIMVGSDYFKSAGDYEVVIERAGSCDSTVFLNLEIIEPVVFDLPIRLCEGEPYSFGGDTYTTEGIYRDTLQSAITGCDSIVILDLKYDPTYLIESFESKCAGDSSFFDNRWIKETGIYDDTLRTMANCDSIARLHLTFLSLDDPVMITETLCFGDSLLFDGVYLKEDGVYRDTLISTQLCDSLVILDLSFRSEQRFVESMTICLGDTVMFEEELFTETGEYSFRYIDVNGCDSTVILNLIAETCPLEIVIDTTNPSCVGNDNGEIRFTLDYGSPPYAFDLYDFSLAGSGNIRSGIIENYGGSDTITDLPAGEYELFIAVTGSTGGAVESFMITLTNESGININTTESMNPSCTDSSDGMITNAINGGFEPYSYLWNDGSEVLSRNGLSAGDYQLIVTDNMGCMDSFNFVMTNPEPVSFQIEQIPPSCAGASDAVIRFTDVVGGAGNYSYNIGFGNEQISVFDNLPSETYILTVEDSNGCMAEGLEVINDPVRFTIYAGDDITLEDLGEIQLSLTTNFTLNQINWTPSDNLSCSDCPNPIANIAATTSFRVTAENETGCEASDQITVILDIDRTVDPAQAFTPNGDGVNDLFIVHGNNSIAEISNIEIYARSGELVWKQESFPINDPNFGWDGTFQGEPMTSQVLGYFVEVIYTDGKTRVFKGQLALIR